MTTIRRSVTGFPLPESCSRLPRLPRSSARQRRGREVQVTADPLATMMLRRRAASHPPSPNAPSERRPCAGTARLESHWCGSNTVTDVAPEALAAEIRQLRELTPTFGIRGVRRSLIEAAGRALEVDDPECRELAEQLLREVRKIPI
jgi:hypothetical protein